MLTDIHDGKLQECLKFVAELTAKRTGVVTLRKGFPPSKVQFPMKPHTVFKLLIPHPPPTANHVTKLSCTLATA